MSAWSFSPPIRRDRARSAGAIGGAIIGSIIGGPCNAGAGPCARRRDRRHRRLGCGCERASSRRNMTQQQINQSAAAGRARADSYRRAIGACLQGRGYTVS